MYLCACVCIRALLASSFDSDLVSDVIFPYACSIYALAPLYIRA